VPDPGTMIAVDVSPAMVEHQAAIDWPDLRHHLQAFLGPADL